MAKNYELYDPTDYLKTPADVADYINEAIEDGEPAVLLAVLGDVVKATRNMSALSKETGVSRDTLYKALSENGNIQFTKLMAILNAMGLELSVREKAA
jgi:probable addiction module antidote protein